MAETSNTWRKLPRNLIKDENIRYISELLPPELKNAPLLFIIVAMSIADDDGIFDLEDGIIFSRLMNCGTDKDVFTVANLLLKRHLIVRAGNTTKCMLTDWEYSIKEKPRTMEERRSVAARQIEAEKNIRQPTFFNTPTSNISEKSEKITAVEPAFFCPVNDKSAENVVNNFYDDKSAENVDEKKDTEKKRIEKIEREEHTQIREIDKTREIEQTQGLQAIPQAFQPCQEEKSESLEITEVIQDERETQETTVNDSVDLASEAMRITQGKQNNEQSSQTLSVLTDFFAKNCLGFTESEHRQALNEIARRIEELGDDTNPTGVIASVFLSQFKQVAEEHPYYKGILISPEKLLSNGVYSTVLAASSKILLNKKSNKEKWQKQVTEYAQEVQAEKAAVGNAFESDYLKYGIDPKAPDAIMRLLQAKKREQGTNPP